MWMKLEDVRKQFTVSSSTSHQVIMVGRQAEFSCQLSPPQSAQHMEMGWFRDHFSQQVYLYKDGEEHWGESRQNYMNRTVFLKDALGEGKMTLEIYNISVFDDGKYHCFFKDGDTYEEAIVNLKVAALGMDIQINVQVPDTEGVMVECNSGGWFPQAQMEWRDSSGNVIPHSLKSYSQDGAGLMVECNSGGWFPQAQMEWRNSSGNVIPHSLKSYSQDGAGLLHLKMSVLLTNSTDGPVTCCFYNPAIGQEKRASIVLSDVLFKSEYMSLMWYKISYPLIYLIILIALLCLRTKVTKSKGSVCFEIVLVGLRFLMFTGIFLIYPKFRNEVSISDDLFQLYSTWMSDVYVIVCVLMLFFTILILFLFYTLKELQWLSVPLVSSEILKATAGIICTTFSMLAGSDS
ncbi:PREDICTED: selection and upkeep of intraepithelial T-cells protein 8-like [Galeopterus variegatus]|uniref:Selection and upkeep of intraepithelial T-cells protein 8-like n=1 Tax=Galeopterus variegatus TaxID=482537 RepID=A0ABM0QDJ3_GALVR|nr:PREDICTED: selection and upkeep of intraepithelial T-cells protein 8-like [Galeopterus variegatus]